MRKAVAHTEKIACPLGQNERAAADYSPFVRASRFVIGPLCFCAAMRRRSKNPPHARLIRRAFIIDLYYCEFLCSACLKIHRFPPPPLIDTYRTREAFSLNARGWVFREQETGRAITTLVPFQLFGWVRSTLQFIKSKRKWLNWNAGRKNTPLACKISRKISMCNEKCKNLILFI